MGWPGWRRGSGERGRLAAPFSRRGFAARMPGWERRAFYRRAPGGPLMPTSASRLAALALASALAGCSPKGPPEPLTIGQLVPLSGPARALGEHARRGAQLAVN